MFIELTDHLRCPAEHDEAFLVLIPDQVSGREVERGFLGCPVCNRQYPVTGGVVQFGARASPGDPVPGSPGGVAPDAAAILSFLELEGPGGYLTLVGSAARFASDLRPLLPGVHFAAVNPGTDLGGVAGVSVLWSPSFPLKARSQRGLVLGWPEAEDAGWRHRALTAVLPGLRITGQGPAPAAAGFELLASAAGWWVGRAG